jgi:hypothetical protein
MWRASQPSGQLPPIIIVHIDVQPVYPVTPICIANFVRKYTSVYLLISTKFISYVFRVLSYYLSIWPAISFSLRTGQGSQTGLVPTSCVGPPVLLYLVVTQSRSGSSDEQRSRPRRMPSNLALDPDLGPDPNPRSAVLQFRIPFEPEEANIFIFDRFLSLIRTLVR